MGTKKVHIRININYRAQPLCKIIHKFQECVLDLHYSLGIQ